MINTPYQSRGFAKFKISRSEAPTGHHPVEGVQRGHDPGPEKPAGERHIQENSGKSSICKGCFPQILGKHHFPSIWTEKPGQLHKFAGHCKREECWVDRRHIGFLHIPGASNCHCLLLNGSIRSQILRWTLNEGNIFYSTFVIISATL